MLGIEIDQKRIFGLDLLRAFAIICVVHGHGAHLLADTWLAPLITLPRPRGVDIFFVLSGFLIGSSFLSYAQRHRKIDRQKIQRFYARSAFRILPNYYTVLLLYIVLVGCGVVAGNLHEFPLWKFFTFTQNLFTPFYNFYWESWSLPVQWWFYILFPLLLSLACIRISPRKATPIICICFIAFTLLYRVSVSKYATDPFWWDVWLRKTVASRCDNIYIGVLAAWVKMYWPEFWKKKAVWSLFAGLILMGVSWMIPTKIGTVYTDLFSLSLPPIAIALWVPFLSGVKSFTTVIGKAFSHLSVLSYAMFLVNLLVLHFIDEHFAEAFRLMGAWGYVVFWLVVLVAAWLLYVAVEKPFVRLRDRFVG
jgi:peptidoglycan/LPS O-acetylase OafA/YrhL